MAKKQVINTNLNEEEKVSTKDISLDSSKEVKNNNSAKTLDSLPNNQVSLEDTPTTKKTKKDSSSVSAVSNDLIVKEEKVEEVSVPKTKKKKEIKEELPTLFNIDEVEAKKQEEIKLTQNLNDDIVQEATPSSKTKDKKVVLNEPTALFNDELVKTKPNVTKNPKPTQKDKNSDVIVAKHSIFSRFKKEKTPIVVRRYQPDLQKGLTADDVEDRIALKLNNKTVTKKSKSYFRIFFDNIFSVFNIAIFAIFGWLISVSLWQQSMFVFVLIINIAIGIVQEIKAKKMIDNFSLITQPTVTVIRDSDTLSVKPEDIVLDDILVLEGGKQIVSDSIIKFGSVEVNESSLTGESDIIIKKPGDQLYSGSFVVSGNCKAIVSSVGKDNYIQKLTSQAKNIKKSKSNLYVSLRNILTFLVVIIVIIFILLFKSMSSHLLDSNAYPSIFQDPNYPELVKKISGAIVGMLPAGLLLCTSVSLAVGVIRLAKRNTLVQDEYSIETLARVDILCLDKTGTITDGTMTVHEVFEYKNPTNYALKQIMSAFINAQGEENSTTKALAERFGLAKKIKHCAIIPFSSQRKFSAVEFEKIGTFVLGASEFVLKENYNMIEREVERHSLDGYRVICLGFTKEHIVENTVEASVVPIALITIKDTIRPNAASIISYFKEIGVGIKVISGDNPMTVSKIAGRVGIDNYYSYISLDGLSDRDVERAASKYTIFGRVTPNQKKILVQTLKKEKHTVAMTGDGVNDILALREANVSIAMASGAEATRNVSNLVLMDSSFASLPKVVQEGRRVINNIQKVATLFLTKTIFSFILAIIGILKGYYPISPSQLYLIDYLVIGIPAFFLALENNNKVVSGNFIWNIFRSSIPGAIVVVIEALIIYAFSSANHFSDETLSTLIAVCTTFTCLMVLARISSPFNKLRGWLFLVMMTVCVLVLCFIPNLLGNIPFWSFKTISNGQSLGTIELLLMIALMEASLPLMLVVANLYKWIKTLIKVTITKLSDLGDVD